MAREELKNVRRCSALPVRTQGAFCRALLPILFALTLGGCQTDHVRNCEDLCERLVKCNGEGVCRHIVENDVKSCRKQCGKTASTYDIECVACLAGDFSWEEPIVGDGQDACLYPDFWAG